MPKNEYGTYDWEEYFNPIFANDLLNMLMPKQEWIVDKLIPFQGITIISGAPKSFKSFIALHIAICIEDDLMVFGKYQATQGGVIIIDEENHLRITKKRLRMLEISEPGGNELLLLNQKGFSASNRDHINALADLCDDLRLDVIIMDSLVRIHRSDENSAKDMAELFDNIKYLCQRGKTVIILHHERKEGVYKSSAQSRMRGSSDISAVVDSHISVRKDPHDKCKITIEHAQSRCAPEEDPFEIRFSEKDGHAEFQYIGESEKQTRESQISRAMNSIPEFLANHTEGITHKNLVQAIIDSQGIGSKTIRNAIKELIESEVIDVQPGLRGNEKLLRLKNNTAE